MGDSGFVTNSVLITGLVEKLHKSFIKID